jgi:hypothetical protein
MRDEDLKELIRERNRIAQDVWNDGVIEGLYDKQVGALLKKIARRVSALTARELELIAAGRGSEVRP